jgi:hypothetical protein
LPNTSYGGKGPFILLDGNLNAYVLSTNDTDTTSSIHNVIKLTKYLPDGAQSWSVTYNNASNYSQESINIIITGNSDILILGIAYSSQFNPDYLVLKYDALGALQWLYQYDSPGYDIPTGFTIDNSGNIYVIGTSYFNGTSQPVPNLIKVSSTGNLIWHHKISDSFSAYTTGGTVSDYNGNVYIQYSYVDFEAGCLFTAKCNPNGDTLWNRIIGQWGMNGSADFCGIQRDSSGYIYTAFKTFWYSGAPTIKIYKYDVSGNLSVLFPFSGSGLADIATLGGFKIMNDNSLIFTGGYSHYSGPSKLLLCKFSSTGSLTRTVMSSYVNNLSSVGNSIAVDKNSNDYITGSAYVSSANQVYLTVKYNSSLDSLYSISYNGPSSINSASSIAVDTLFNVYVAGLSSGNNTSTVATIKYSQLSEIIKISNTIPDKFSLSQNYPNPFNPSTKIKFSIRPPLNPLLGKEGTGVVLKVYDNLGREVAILVNERLQPGTYEVEWDATDLASGIYLYKLSATEFTETKRMVLIK